MRFGRSLAIERGVIIVGINITEVGWKFQSFAKIIQKRKRRDAQKHHALSKQKQQNDYLFIGLLFIVLAIFDIALPILFAALPIVLAALPIVFDALPAIVLVDIVLDAIGVDEFIVIVFDEFIVEFIVEFIILLVLVLELFAASPQAIPNALKVNTAERAKVFFILIKFSCLLQRLSFSSSD